MKGQKCSRGKENITRLHFYSRVCMYVYIHMCGHACIMVCALHDVSEGRRTSLDVSSHLLPCFRQVLPAYCCKHWTSWAGASRVSHFYTLPSLCRNAVIAGAYQHMWYATMWAFRIHTPVLLLAWCTLYLQKHLPSQKGNTCFNEDRSACFKKNRQHYQILR